MITIGIKKKNFALWIMPSEKAYGFGIGIDPNNNNTIY
jgi:hypothetical protein